MDQEGPFRVPPALAPASSSSNPTSKAPTSRLPRSTLIAPTTQLPHSRLPTPSSNAVGLNPTPSVNPPSAPLAMSSSSKGLSLDISSALTRLFSRAEDVHRQSSLFKALPPAEVYKEAGFSPTPAQLAYRDEVKRKSMESEKAMKVEVKGVVEQVRAALAAEVKTAASNIGLKVSGPSPVESGEVVRAGDADIEKQVIVVLKRLASLEKSLQEERQARQDEAKVVLDQQERNEASRRKVDTLIASLEDQKVVREREMETLRKEKAERDIEMENMAVELKKNDALQQTLLERLEKLEAAPVPPTLEGFVRQENLDSTNKKQQDLQESLKNITGSTGEMEVLHAEFEKRLSEMESATEELRKGAEKLSKSQLNLEAHSSKRHSDLLKHVGGLASTTESLPELVKSRDFSNGEKIAALVKANNTLKEGVDKKVDYLKKCLSGSEDSFLKTELSIVQTKIEHITSLELPDLTSNAHPTALHEHFNKWKLATTAALSGLTLVAQPNKAILQDLLLRLQADDDEETATLQDLPKKLMERLTNLEADRLKAESAANAVGAVLKIEKELHAVKVAAESFRLETRSAFESFQAEIRKDGQGSRAYVNFRLLNSDEDEEADGQLDFRRNPGSLYGPGLLFGSETKAASSSKPVPLPTVLNTGNISNTSLASSISAVAPRKRKVLESSDSESDVEIMTQSKSNAKATTAIPRRTLAPLFAPKLNPSMTAPNKPDSAFHTQKWSLAPSTVASPTITTLKVKGPTLPSKESTTATSQPSTSRASPTVAEERVAKKAKTTAGHEAFLLAVKPVTGDSGAAGDGNEMIG